MQTATMMDNTRVLAREPSDTPPFTEEEAGEYLTWKSRTSDGLVLQVGKIGAVRISARTVEIRNQTVEVTFGKNNFLHLNVHETRAHRGYDLTPGNADLNRKLIAHIAHAITCKKQKKGRAGQTQPVGVCFDQAYQ